MAPNSLAHCPTFTPTTEPRIEAFVIPAERRAAYPRSRSCRCCGSIAAASAAEMLKKVCSKSWLLQRKLPCRTRLATSGALPPRCAAACCTSHRDRGISHSRSWPQLLVAYKLERWDTPIGSARLSPMTATGASAHARATAALPVDSDTAAALLVCRWSVTCRAVGWSKTNVLGRADAPSPSAWSGLTWE